MVNAAFHIRSSGLSSLGRVRKQNEDVWTAEGGLFVLADGMGGHKAGEVAAAMAVGALKELLCAYPGGSREAVAEKCKEAVLAVNEKVHAAGLEREEWAGMGTTLTALLFTEKLVCVTHVGDSRAYRVRENCLKQLTVDHTVMNRMKGAKEAVLFRHVLTRAIGTQPTVKPQVQTFPVKAGDRYLLCSDGLNNHVSDDEILTMMTQNEPLELINSRLIDLANERGGSDNSTVIALEVLA